MAITDVPDTEVGKLAAEINKADGVTKFWHLDVSNEKDVESIYAKEVQEFYKLDAP